MTVHALAGLPRSGSTLLANILSQHPDVYVSGTSPLFGCVAGMSEFLTKSPEAKAMQANVPGAYENMLNSMKALVGGWYAHRDEPCIIDKGRGWATRPALLSQLDPDARTIVCVRDPRDVVASVIRRDRDTALFASENGLAIQDQITNLMTPQGLVGGPLHFIESMLRSGFGAAWVRYDMLTTNPQIVLDRLCDGLEIDAFTFDFENVVNVAPDLDALYNGKFPHEGSGQVKPSGSRWADTLSPDAGAWIAARFPLFMETFGYQES